MKKRVCLSLVAFFTIAAFLLLIPTSADSPGLLAEQGIRPASPVGALNPARKGARARIESSYGKLPLSFEPNQGQASKEVKFLSRGRGYTLFLTNDEAVFGFRSGGEQLARKGEKAGTHTHPAKTAVLRMRLMGTSQSAQITGTDELPGKSNYFIGKNPKKWQTNVPNYAKVRYGNVYPGIDLVYYGNQGQLEYDFVLAPGADLKAITLAIAGTKDSSSTRLAENGDLVIKAGSGEVCFHKPVVYQTENSGSATSNRKSIDGRFVLLAKNRIGFEVSSYDRTKPLIIDPTLAYSTYLGGTSGGVDAGLGVAVDLSGSAYVTGVTNSADFPTTAGAFHSAFSADTCTITSNQIVRNYTCDEAFVTKLNASGTALVYSTYIGGSSNDMGRSIAVDSEGSAYVTGNTGSTDFPTVNPIQATAAMGGNVFVAKLNAAGDELVYSTYLSGNVAAAGGAIAVDSTGSAYVTGQTVSMDFPTMNPIQGTIGGAADAFVAKLNGAGSALVYSTYLGGSQGDGGGGIAVDSAGFAYITGGTNSTNFPTVNALQATFGGGNDAFVAKLNADGSALVYSTYLGGSGWDVANAIATDLEGSAYVTGITTSPESDFPTVNGFQPNLNGPVDAFVTKLDESGGFVYFTYLGGSGGEGGSSITADSAGSAYVAGTTDSTDFPTMNALQAASGGGVQDAFVAKLNAFGTALDFSTYLGGSGRDAATAFSLDGSGNAYITGQTGVGAFPATPGALQSEGPAAANCIPYPSGYVPFTQITSQTAGLVVGTMTLEAYGQLMSIPLPTFPGEGFCTMAGLAPGQYFANAAVPNVAERNGDFSGYGPIINPFTGEPFLNNIIPASMFGSVFAWPVNGLAPPSNAFVVKISGFPASGPMVTLSPSSLDFGEQVITSRQTKTVTLTNSGAAPLTVNSVGIYGDVDHFQYDGQDCMDSNPIAPEKTCTISLTFVPQSTGEKSVALQVSSNATGTPHEMIVTGVGILPALDVSPLSLDFNEQKVGTTSEAQTVTVTNTGTTPVTISDVKASANFTVTNNCGSSVTAGGSCTLGVAFVPTATGSVTDQIVITYVGAGSPQSVTVAGTGTAPAIGASPTSLSFEDQLVGSTSEAQAITLTNTGTAAANFSSIEATGDFSLTNNCGSSLAAGENCTLEIAFAPKAAGSVTEQAIVAYDGADSPLSINLTGAGNSPALSVSPSSLTFDDQLVGTTSEPQTVTVTNTGSAPLNISGIEGSTHFTHTHNCGTSLAAGGNCTINVTFAPKSAGPVTEQITITHDGAGSPESISLSGTGTDFSILPASGTEVPPATITAGEKAIYNLSINPAGFAGGVAMGCKWSGVKPNGASCSVSPASLNLDGTHAVNVAVSVTTAARSMAPVGWQPEPRAPNSYPVSYLAMWLLGLVALAGLALRRRRVSIALASALFLVMLWTACGGGSSSPSTSTPVSGTEAGTYSLTVTATASGMTHSTDLTLVVN